MSLRKQEQLRSNGSFARVPKSAALYTHLLLSSRCHQPRHPTNVFEEAPADAVVGQSPTNAFIFQVRRSLISQLAESCFWAGGRRPFISKRPDATE
jgi:hypothetical protein